MKPAPPQSTDAQQLGGMSLRFTIRDLAWLTVGMALTAAWWSERSRHKPKLYDVDLTDDGATVPITNHESGITVSMSSDSFDEKKLMQSIKRPTP